MGILAAICFALGLIIFGLLYAVVAFASTKRPHWSRKDLGLLGLFAGPIGCFGMAVLGYALVWLSENPTDPLDDAPQRSFFILVFFLFALAIVSMPIGALASWAVARRRERRAVQFREADE
jgi:Na+/proline symporter